MQRPRLYKPKKTRSYLQHKPQIESAKAAMSSQPVLIAPNGKANGNATPAKLPRLHRANFGDGFVFGTASAAYQYEGAAKAGGKGKSIWDTFTHKWPGRIADGSNGNAAVDFYNRFKEDVETIKRMGFDAFRFSISWTRILPSGKLNGGVNREGVNFYNKLIDEIVAHGLKPFVTLFHWDLPQFLEDEYGGFLSPRVVDDFCDYVDVCFWEFGDRVKHWITLNEPWSYSNAGYATGSFAPGRGSTSTEHVKAIPHNLHRGSTEHHASEDGDPGTEPYLATHHQILAHAAAVRLYKQKYQKSQEGQIGVTIVTQWMVPYSNSSDDKDAAQRALDFVYGWFMDPITTGDYPRSMRKLVRKRLPEFSESESEMVKGSYDFIGLNYYTSKYVANTTPSSTPSYLTDANVTYPSERDGKPIGPTPGSSWLHVFPEGLYDLLIYTKQKYDDPVIFITENGLDEVTDYKKTLKDCLVDTARKRYHVDHLHYLLDAIHDGVKVRGYFQWSLLDNFEWARGYNSRFGTIYVDLKDGNFTRYPKESAKWFMNFLKKET